MGTNYYWYPRPDPCPTCGHDPSKKLHIGHSAAGWCFSLNTHPDQNLNNLEHWLILWATTPGTIRDEYGQEHSVMAMLKNILNRQRPEGLRRHDLDGVHCVGHGFGTYDLMRMN